MSVAEKIDFQSLAENSADILCCTGMDGVLHYVSSVSLEVLGWKPEEMTGKILMTLSFLWMFPYFPPHLHLKAKARRSECARRMGLRRGWRAMPV